MLLLFAASCFDGGEKPIASPESGNGGEMASSEIATARSPIPMLVASPRPPSPLPLSQGPDAARETIVSDIDRGLSSVQEKPKARLSSSDVSPDLEYLLNAPIKRKIGPVDIDIGPLSLGEGEDAVMISQALTAFAQAQGGRRPLGSILTERADELVIALSPLIRGDVSAQAIRFGAVRRLSSERAQLFVKLMSRASSTSGSIEMRTIEGSSWVISDIAVRLGELAYVPSARPSRFEPETFQTDF